jgi:hypothetical protein
MTNSINFAGVTGSPAGCGTVTFKADFALTTTSNGAALEIT